MLTFLTVVSASLSAAPMGYSINSDSGSGNSDSLYLIDLATGTDNRIGVVQLPSTEHMDVEGLAFHPDGTLYGIDDQSLKMFPIDTATGLIDLNNIINIDTDDNTDDLTAGSNDFGMTFDCDANLFITSVTKNSLYLVDLNNDPDNDNTHSIGSLVEKIDGDKDKIINISALAAYGSPARLYGLGNGTKKDSRDVDVKDSPNLYEIDIDTATVTNKGPLGPEASDYTQGGLAFDSSGQLWAITDRTGLLDDSGPSQIMRVNTSTGAASDIRNTSELGFESLAIAVPGGCAPTSTGETATFVVQKRFTDHNNITPVTLNFQCNGGTVLNPSRTILPNEGEFGFFEVIFVVDQFSDGSINCEVWEDPPPGYTPEYDCQSETSCSTSEGAEPCSFQNVRIGQQDLCLIHNAPTPVDVDVTKVWEENGAGGDAFSTDVTIQVFCDAEIVDGVSIGGGTWRQDFDLIDESYLDENGNYTGEATVTAEVIPNWFPPETDPDEEQETSVCWTGETNVASAVELTSDCGSTQATARLQVSLGSGDSCTMTNTVFFEGIPTLSQYGLILISALMLLTGLIAVRRTG